jgi:RNA polymerase sigma factor (sigma-70 family)
MAHRPLDLVVGRLRRLAGPSPVDDLADRLLLERFALNRDEAAFETLLRRHGPMVLGVCRRLLGDRHAAEDAFQATFLILVRRAGSLGRHGTLAGWLYTVARHTALRARADARRRSERERQVPPRAGSAEPGEWRELRPLLDEEIGRLPDRFRLPLVLCYLEGMTNEEAARRLGCPTGTVLSRLARARARLRGRLTRRGITLSVAALGALLSEAAAPAAPPTALLAATHQAAAGMTASTAVAAAGPALTLMHEVVNAMFWTRIKLLLVCLVAAGLTGTGSVLLLTSRPAAAAAAVAAAPPADAAPKPEKDGKDQTLFEDLTAQAGIRFTYRNGEEAGHYAILEAVGAGVALLDYDGDGLLDIFVTGGGHFDKSEQQYKKDPKTKPRIVGNPCNLYRNLGNFKFKDVTKEAGLDGINFYSHGAAVADYDRDGWPDLLVTGYGRVALFHNVPDGKGGRRFVDVTKKAGLGGPGAGALANHFWATGAAWADLDGDGYPDLYLCQYVNWSWHNNPACAGYSPTVPRDICPPKQFEARPHALYRNNGKGGFVDVTKEAGIRCDRPDKEYGKGLGVVIVDVNGDGRPDIFVANDTTARFLYLNRSQPGRLRFDDLGLEMGVAVDDRGVPTGSAGCDAGDPFGIGRPSLWITGYENELPGLYRNEFAGGRSLFTNATVVSGIPAMGQLYVGFGTGFLDVDNDGWEDLVIANGHVIMHPTRAGLRQRPVVLHNKGGGRFEVATDRAGPYFQFRHRGRGVAIGDLDNDGRADLVISHLNEPVAVLRNVAEPGHHWLGVELVGKDRADVVGARLTLDVGNYKLRRFVKGGGSYLSSGDRRILFGLGKTEKVGRLIVEWPWGGGTQQFENLAIDRYHRLLRKR